jgi:hypothetical protein
LPQCGKWNENASPDSPNGKSLVGDEVVESAQADGQYLGCILTAEKELFFGANWRLLASSGFRTRGGFHGSTLLFQGMPFFLAQCCTGMPFVQ